MKKIIHYKLLLVTLVISLFTTRANAADGSGHEIGFSVGPNFALTDLGGAQKIGATEFGLRDIDFRATRYSISAFYRYNINNWLAVRGNLMYGMLSADDKHTDGTPPGPDGPSDSWYRARRNLNFTTHMIEFQAITEVNLKKYNHEAGKGDKERWAPYVGGGLGFFWFNPYTKLNGEKVKLRPLGTEGQFIRNSSNGYNKPYSNFQFDLMALVGIKYNVTEKFSIALEGIYHQTFTDYLDDVSGNYINAEDVPSLTPLGQALQNRANETDGKYPNNLYNFVEGQKPNNVSTLKPFGAGNQRGDKTDNDQFLHIQLTFTFTLSSGKRLGFGSCGKKNPYKHKFSCPKW
ncbi:MAG TPA: DUF6089 family protein [Chitinophagales bacterium]|nr:DUF6089 family protein [Chitinophagales bacterium]